MTSLFDTMASLLSGGVLRRCTANPSRIAR